MGTWGTGIFSDDLASDIREDFKELIGDGKSPSSDIGTKLHVDHIKPFSKGGKTVLENLQTLCFDCNLGKGNKKL